MKKIDSDKNIFEKFRNNISSIKYTIASAVSVILVFIISSIFNLHIYDTAVSIFTNISDLGMGGILISLLFILTGLAIDFYRKELRYRQNVILKNNSYLIFKATMESINDILCNYIQSMQLYKLELEGKTDANTFVDFDALTETTIHKLRNLQLLEEINSEVLTADLSVLKYKSIDRIIN